MEQRRKWGEKMKIQIGERIYLNSDSQCYWITQEKEVKRGNNAGKLTEKRITGYFRNLTDLLSDIPERKIRECDAETIKELKDVVSSTESLVREIVDKLSRFNKELEIDEDTFPM